GVRPQREAPLLRVPPFPGSRRVRFARVTGGESAPLSDNDLAEIIVSVRSGRVGGTYWASQPPLPEQPYTLVRIRDRQRREQTLASLSGEAPALCWVDQSERNGDRGSVVSGECDPWHLIDRAASVIADCNDDLALLAAIAGKPLKCIGEDRFDAAAALCRQIKKFEYFDPFTGDAISFARAVEYCASWRALVDRNRDIGGAVGFAFWKRPTVAPLLWGGSKPVDFTSNAASAATGDCVAMWKARTSPTTTAALERRGVQLIEVEDGFIRSAGLGADCVPPLSIIVDRLGPHFDPSYPSELEQLLEESQFSAELLERAKSVREAVVESGVSKYSAGHKHLEPRRPGRRHVLVTGQVEDDRAVVSGGGGLTSNLELLRRVRAIEPDAYLLYKPHPDIEAGHRAGAISDDVCLTVADEIVRDEPISALLDLAGEIHVNTSLAGFEALMRGKPVTTHGVPFYAGWGLTRDLAPTPSRRTRTLTLDELVAAVLLLYPRYLDPVTRLPCPAEVLVRRLSEPADKGRDGLTVGLRRLQGRCRRGLSALLGYR
ncbi:MAG TPA: capsule biosynthesis protein, partial [Sphingomicrobium sp.]|nr:capsule biosynthesis protein [Sphingomicrobium sp.]